MAEKPQVLSRDLIDTIDRYIVQLQTDGGGDSATKIGVLEDLRNELRTHGTIPFAMGDPGATVLWELMEQGEAARGE